jgi:hypothetical protein
LPASVTPLIETGAHSIGWLFSYPAEVWIVVPCIVGHSIRAAVGLKSNAEGVSLGVKSVQ